MMGRTLRGWAGPIGAWVVVGAIASAQGTSRARVDSAGGQGDGSSFEPSLSADGRFAAFSSFATNLVPGDTDSRDDVFVHGAPLFLPALFDAFDAQGVWSLGAAVPAGLAGHAFTFLGFGITPTGKAGASDVARVSFQ